MTHWQYDRLLIFQHHSPGWSRRSRSSSTSQHAPGHTALGSGGAVQSGAGGWVHPEEDTHINIGVLIDQQVSKTDRSLTRGSCSGKREATSVLLRRTWSPEEKSSRSQFNDIDYWMEDFKEVVEASVCVFLCTCQQSTDGQMYGHFVLRHLVPECLHAVTSQTQADWLLTVCKAALTVNECSQTLLIGLDQHLLLTHTQKHIWSDIDWYWWIYNELNTQLSDSWNMFCW